MRKLIEVTPQVFVPDYESSNPFDVDVVSKGTILINIDYIKLIEGNCIVLDVGGEDRFYSVFECYEELKEKIAKVRKEYINE